MQLQLQSRLHRTSDYQVVGGSKSARGNKVVNHVVDYKGNLVGGGYPCNLVVWKTSATSWWIGSGSGSDQDLVIVQIRNVASNDSRRSNQPSDRRQGGGDRNFTYP